MPYATAAAQPLPASGNWSNRVYARHGLMATAAAHYRQAGVPASVAAALHARGMNRGEVTWLASVFSRPTLRARAASLTSTEVGILRTLFPENPVEVRRYFSQPLLSVTEARGLVRMGVPARLAADWIRLHPELARPVLGLSARLATASVLYRLDNEALIGWLRFAVERGCVASPGRGFDFLGGDTLLFLQAGVGVAEAEAKYDAGGVNREALAFLSALRAGA